ncbi:hypothetical protein CDAR_367731, partial [Caerostris darwini]
FESTFPLNLFQNIPQPNRHTSTLLHSWNEIENRLLQSFPDEENLLHFAEPHNSIFTGDGGRGAPQFPPPTPPPKFINAEGRSRKLSLRLIECQLGGRWAPFPFDCRPGMLVQGPIIGAP